MGEYSKKLHFAKNGVTTDITLYDEFGAEVPVPALHYKHGEYETDITLYDSLADVGGDDAPCIYVEDAAQTAYAKLVSPDAANATALRAKHNDVTYAVADSKNDSVIGLALNNPDSDSNTWVRVDISGNDYTFLDFDNIYPWSGVKSVTIDGQAMVKIPKFYVKSGVISAGEYAGKRARWVSGKKLQGFHLHPAFVKNNKVMDCFYIGAYEAYKEEETKAGSKADTFAWGVTVPISTPKMYCNNRNTDENDVEKRGWHLQNVYEISAVNYLLYVELTPKVPELGNYTGRKRAKAGTTNAKYRGICEWWGDLAEYVDGVYMYRDRNYQLFDKHGTGTMVETSLMCPVAWSSIVDTDESLVKGRNYDLSDVFFASVAEKNEKTFPRAIMGSNYNESNAYEVCRGGECYEFELDVSPFTLGSFNGDTNRTGFRIAKYGEVTNEIAYDD